LALWSVEAIMSILHLRRRDDRARASRRLSDDLDYVALVERNSSIRVLGGWQKSKQKSLAASAGAGSQPAPCATSAVESSLLQSILPPQYLNRAAILRTSDPGATG